jgi:DNA invertase Pin-like site-specific DNA recombinase
LAKLAVYRRVSQVGDRKERLRSPEQQLKEVTDWAKPREHELVVLDPELDRKGNDASRPILREAVEGVKAGEFDGVAVAYLSRSGRDLRLMLDLWDEVEGVGGAVYSARENIDGSTPSGRLHRNILASIAQHELEDRREGFAKSREDAVARKIHITGRVPMGYRRGKDRILEEDSATAPIVREMFRRRAAGESWPAIARYVSEQLGRPIQPQSVGRIVGNRVYLGEARNGEYVHPEAHPALVDRATWEAAQLKHPRPPRGKNGAPLLSGVVYCAGCARLMVPTTRSDARVYRCRRHHEAGACPAPAYVGQWIEKLVEETVRKLMKGRGYKASRVNAQLAKAEHALSDAETARDDFAVATSGLAREDIAAGMKAHAESVKEARRQLAEARATAVAVPDVRDWDTAWEDLTPEKRQRLLRAALGAVVVKRGAGTDAERVRLLAPGASLIPDQPVDFDSLEDVVLVA